MNKFVYLLYFEDPETLFAAVKEKDIMAVCRILVNSSNKLYLLGVQSYFDMEDIFNQLEVRYSRL